MDEKKDRETLPDILRGFAIILVVFAHCIQQGSGTEFSSGLMYFSDRLYQLIYSFHMPLFMMISGYLSWGSVRKADDKILRRALLRRRASSLLIPIFLWTGLDYIRILVTNYINGAAQPQALVFVYFYNALNNLWFLWAVWWCFVIVYVVHYFMNDSRIVYILGFLILFIIPDGLNLGAYKFMMPYFIISFYVHGFIRNIGIEKIEKWKYFMLTIFSLAFIGLFLLYNEESFIYLTGYKLIGKNILHQLYIDFYRMIIGFVGSWVFILLWKCITDRSRCEFKTLRLLGADSMGIYILSGYIIVFASQLFGLWGRKSYILNIVETVVVLMLSFLLVEIIAKVPYIRKFVGK